MVEWDVILDAVSTAAGGQTDIARTTLHECWDRTQVNDHAERCVIAHFLADQQTEFDAETAWDERALNEHAQVSETAFVPIGVPSAAEFAPSLHLNLGDDYLRAGDADTAWKHLGAARAAMHLLADDGYGAMIRSGIDRLGQRLDAATTGTIF